MTTKTIRTGWPANHVARFVSRVRQFLWRNRAVFCSIPESGTRKIWYQIDWHTCKFLVPVSVACVAGFIYWMMDRLLYFTFQQYWVLYVVCFI